VPDPDADLSALVKPGEDLILDSMLEQGMVINRRTYLEYNYPEPPEYWSSDLEDEIPDVVREPAWVLPWNIEIR
jgi:hypothetical protein